MKVLDLFSGLGGFSQAFKNRGHDVTTIDNDIKFNPTICMNIMDLKPNGIHYDVILASPPCNCFSVMTISRYWDQEGNPKPETIQSIELVKHTINFIIDSRPKFWFLENPRAMLRTVIGNPPVTVYYAQYGEDRLKPTDIWGRHPSGFKEMQIKDRSLLEYTKVARGSNVGGTQVMESPELRAKIPYKLSETICKLCEKELR